TQNLAKLLKDKMVLFQQFTLSEDTLAQAKQRYLEALDRAEKENALRQANAVITRFSSYPYFEMAKQRAMIEQISLADIQQMREKLLNKATSLRVLAVGNLSDNQVKQIATE
ncbi:pitrilysin, partial [Glaesserella parasuis]|nr:pitrilysin [Glaesserella parasuis]